MKILRHFCACLAIMSCACRPGPSEPAPTDAPPSPRAPAPARESGPNLDPNLEQDLAQDLEREDPHPDSSDPPPKPDLIAELLASDPELAAAAAAAPDLRLQILLTPLEPGATTTTTHRYRVGDEYVFTASCIKTFVSVAALRTVQRIRGVSVDSPIGFCEHEPGKETKAVCPTKPSEDDTNVDTHDATLRHEIRKMHLVSNNHSFNRLYDFVGHEALHVMMWKLGFESLRIRHRMGQSYAIGRNTPPMVFFGEREGAVFEEIRPARRSTLTFPPTTAPGIEVGKAHVGRGRMVVEEPRDFSRKNHVSLDDLHLLLASIVRPELDMSRSLGLTKAHRRLLVEAMTEDPAQSKNPKFEGRRFSGHRYKLMWKGITKVVPASAVRYVNKPGKAYGFHIESAYVENTETGRAFLVTAAIYVNKNGIVGDDLYEYDEVSKPFFQHLGEVLAERLLLPVTGSGDTEGE